MKWGFPKIRGILFGGPNNKDYRIFGSILGSPYFGKFPNSQESHSLLSGRGAARENDQANSHWDDGGTSSDDGSDSI